MVTHSPGTSRGLKILVPVIDSIAPRLSKCFHDVSMPTRLNHNNWQGDLLGSKDSGDSLRAVHVTVNEAARRENLAIFENMRVPENSVIHRVFRDIPSGEAVENLSSWKTSKGFKLADRVVKVEAKRSWKSVDALLFPTISRPTNKPSK